MARRPDFFIIGAAKSGTTSLYDYLAGHPDIYMSPVKEPFYFSPDIQGGLRRRFTYGEDLEKYLALFADAQNESRLGEASTRYLTSRVAPQYINEFAPDARAIAMLRNPVDFLYALHNERVAGGFEPVDDFERALALDESRRAGLDLPPGANPLGAVYREQALFGEQLERWLGAIGRPRLHVIIFDDFARDTAGEFRRVLEFLDVDPEYAPSTFAVRNPSHRMRGGLVRAAIKSPPARFVARRVLPSILGKSGSWRLAKKVRHSRLNRTKHERPPMKAELRERLVADFTADVHHLSALLGRDLTAEWFGSERSTP